MIAASSFMADHYSLSIQKTCENFGCNEKSFVYTCKSYRCLFGVDGIIFLHIKVRLPNISINVLCPCKVGDETVAMQSDVYVHVIACLKPAAGQVVGWCWLLNMK